MRNGLGQDVGVENPVAVSDNPDDAAALRAVDAASSKVSTPSSPMRFTQRMTLLGSIGASTSRQTSRKNPADMGSPPRY